MGMIDTTDWGEFRVGALFDIHPTKAYKMNNAELLDGGMNPVIANSAYNNGIGGTSSQPTTENGNMITFSDTVDANTIFYQPNPFVGYAHVQGLYPVGQYANCWTARSLQFFATSFRKTALRHGFDYGNKFRRDIAVDLKVKLPVDANGNPDWQYMEDYMKSIEVSVCNLLSKLASAKDTEKKQIDVSGWGKYHLYDIFDISMGNKFDRSKMNETIDDVNFVGRSAFNNGVACTVSFVNDNNGNKVEPYKAGDITIAMGGSIGSSFIQQRDFYTSQNVCVLHTDNPLITYKVKQFIISSIYISCANYEAFVDELNRHIKTDFVLYLPTLNGQPDWAYMEQYMRDIEAKAIQTLDSLAS